MKIMNVFLEKFLRKKKEDNQEEPVEKAFLEEPEPQFETSEDDPACLELSHEHPLYRLYDLRTEKSRNTPPPELIMKGCDDLPESKVRQELMGFRAALPLILKR